MSQPKHQSLMFRGIYEFEDPSASLIAAKIPAAGTVDLYSDTVVVVKPNQGALFVYKGQIADTMKSGTFQITTQNVPFLTKLASWKFGFESPLRCELIFFAYQIFTSRRWGTQRPILVKFDNFPTSVPIRAFGNFNIQLTDPLKFFSSLFGTRSTYSVAELDEFIQGQIAEILPDVFNGTGTLEKLSTAFEEYSRRIEVLLNRKLAGFGFSVSNLQVLSALPSKEIIEALEAKSAIQIIGSQKEYLLYKAANSLSASESGTSNDPLQMMMGLMLGKGLIGNDYHDKESKFVAAPGGHCIHCGTGLVAKANFCSGCGKKV